MTRPAARRLHSRRRQRLGLQRLESRHLLAMDVAGVIDVDTVWNMDVNLTGDVFVRNGATLTINSGVSITGSSTIYDLSVANDNSNAKVIASNVTFLVPIRFAANAEADVSGSTFGARLRIDGTGEQNLDFDNNTFNSVPTVQAEYVGEMANNNFVTADVIDVFGTINSDTTWPLIPDADQYRLVGDVRVDNGAKLTLSDGVRVTRSSTIYDICVSCDGTGAGLIANNVDFLTFVNFHASAMGSVTNSNILALFTIRGDDGSTLNVTDNTFNVSPSAHAEYLPRLAANTFLPDSRIDVFGAIDNDTTWPKITNVAQYQLVGDVTVVGGSTLTFADDTTVTTSSSIYDLRVSADTSGSGLNANDVSILAPIFLNESATGVVTNNTFGAALSIFGDSASALTVTGNTFDTTPSVQAEFVPRLALNTFAVDSQVNVFGNVDSDTTWPSIPGVIQYRLTGDVRVVNGADLTLAGGISVAASSSIYDLFVSSDNSNAGLIANNVSLLATVFLDDTATGGVTNSSISDTLSIGGTDASPLAITGNMFFSPPSVHAEFVPRMAANTFDLASRIEVFGAVTVDTTWPSIIGVGEYRITSDVLVLNGSTLTLADSISVAESSPLYDLIVASDNSVAKLIGDDIDFRVNVLFNENADGNLTNSRFAELVRLNGDVDLRFAEFDSSASLEVVGSYGGVTDYSDFSALGNNDVTAIGLVTDTIDLTDNWWGTTVAAEIEAKILHQPDAAQRPLIVFEPFLLKPPTVPDYIPLQLLTPDDPLIAGSTIPIQFDVRNDSLFGDAEDHSAVLIYLNKDSSQNASKLLEVTLIQPLDAGTTTGLRSVLVTLPVQSDPIWSTGLPGDYTLSALVDATDNVLESYDNNNLISTTISVVPPIVVVSESYEISELVEGIQDDSIGLTLSTIPTADVVIVATPNDQLDLGNGPGQSKSITITPGDAEETRLIDVSAISDDFIEGPHLGKISYSVSSEDARFDGTAMPQSEIMILEQATRPVIDSVIINENDNGRSQFTSLNVQFDRLIDHSLLGDAFKLTNTTTDTQVTSLVVAATDNAGRTRVEIRFGDGPSVVSRTADGSNSLADGIYRFEIVGSSIAAVAGGHHLADDFAFGNRGPGRVANDDYFRLFGDSDGDRDVDGQDYGRFGLSFLASAEDPSYNEVMDFDGDGDVDGQDYGQFGLRFLTTIE